MISGCPSTQNANTGSGVATATVSWTPPNATDNSGTQTLSSDYSPGDSFPIGTTTVTYTSTDESGNTNTCTFDVVVSGEFHVVFLALSEVHIATIGIPNVPDLYPLCFMSSLYNCIDLLIADLRNFADLVCRSFSISCVN